MDGRLEWAIHPSIFSSIYLSAGYPDIWMKLGHGLRGLILVVHLAEMGPWTLLLLLSQIDLDGDLISHHHLRHFHLITFFSSKSKNPTSWKLNKIRILISFMFHLIKIQHKFIVTDGALIIITNIIVLIPYERIVSLNLAMCWGQYIPGVILLWQEGHNRKHNGTLSQTTTS